MVPLVKGTYEALEVKLLCVYIQKLGKNTPEAKMLRKGGTY
jgi:hypothetical protein